MYKFLTKKLEESKGVHIEDVVLIAFAVNNQSENYLLEDFGSMEFSKICKTLNWKDEEEVHNLIAEEIEVGGNIAGLMYRYNSSGFLAKVHIEIPTLLNSKSDKPRFSYSEGYCRIEYVYAGTLAELVDKALKIGAEVNELEIKKALDEKNKVVA